MEATRCEVRLGDVVLGTSLLGSPGSDGIQSGRFDASESYDLVRPIFRLFATAQLETDPAARELAVERYRKARAALKLSLIDASGRAVPVISIHIVDTGSLKHLRHLRLDVQPALH